MVELSLGGLPAARSEQSQDPVVLLALQGSLILTPQSALKLHILLLV